MPTNLPKPDLKPDLIPALVTDPDLPPPTPPVKESDNNPIRPGKGSLLKPGQSLSNKSSKEPVTKPSSLPRVTTQPVNLNQQAPQNKKVKYDPATGIATVEVLPSTAPSETSEGEDSAPLPNEEPELLDVPSPVLPIPSDLITSTEEAACLREAQQIHELSRRTGNPTKFPRVLLTQYRVMRWESLTLAQQTEVTFQLQEILKDFDTVHNWVRFLRSLRIASSPKKKLRIIQTWAFLKALESLVTGPSV